MGEIGSNNGSSYPGVLDTDLVLEVDSPGVAKTLARAAVPNDLSACIVAIESTLGIDPQGTKTDVKTNLQTEHNANGTHKSSLVITNAGTQTITGNKTFSGNVQGIPMLPGSSNLKGDVASDSTFTITADYVYFSKPGSFYNGYLLNTNGTTYTNTITIAGPIINGQDQASVFTVSSWIHFYLIYNPTTSTIASLSSGTAPITGPTLPTDYTMWAYIGAVYVDSGGLLTPCRIRNNHVYYDGQKVALNGGTSESAASIDLAEFVPENANEVLVNALGITTGSPTSRTFSLEHVTGYVYATIDLAAANRATGQVLLPLTTAQTIYYLIDSNAGSTTFTVWVAGFTIPNGAR